MQGADQPQGRCGVTSRPKPECLRTIRRRRCAEGGHGLDGAVAVLRPAVRYQGHVLIENRSGLIVANCVSRLHHGGMNEFGNRC